MDAEKFSHHVERIIKNRGKIEVVNSKDQSVDITDDVLNLIESRKNLSNALINAKTELSKLKKDQEKFSFYKSFYNEILLRLELISQTDDYTVRRKIREMNEQERMTLKMTKVAILDSDVEEFSDFINKSKKDFEL